MLHFMKKIIKCSNVMTQALDDEQRIAVEAPLQNICVTAIAGSGKTRVLTYRVANLIENGYQESQMLLLTFTNKAAQEMTGRIRSLLNKETLSLASGTFHGIASAFIRMYAKQLGITENFSVLTGYRQKELFEHRRKNMLKSYKENEENFPSASVLLELYSGAINHDKPFVQYIRETKSWLTASQEDMILTLFKDYVEQKHKENLLDFDDLLIMFYDMLHDYPDIKESITSHYPFIFVDEYQDINPIQFDILKMLNQNNQIFVIGDAAQCIYQFRGSRDDYIEKFAQDYPDAAVYRLTYNYRSDGNILKLAEDVINHNNYQTPIVCNTVNEEGLVPMILECENEYHEAEYVAQMILAGMKQYEFQYEEIAVLVRKGTQISIIQQALKDHQIPYKEGGEKSLYDQPYMKDLVAVISAQSNPRDETTMIHVIQMLSNIRKDKAEQIYQILMDQNFQFDKAKQMIPDKFSSAILLLAEICSCTYDNVAELIDKMLNLFFRNYLLHKYKNGEEHLKHIEQMAAGCTSMKKSSSFLDLINLNRNSQHETKKHHVTVTTMHKAKGLEWDMVILPFMTKGEFPKCRAREYRRNDKNVKNERNLLYVGITRARYFAMLTYSKQKDGQESGMSPFLKEINSDLYELETPPRT